MKKLVIFLIVFLSFPLITLAYSNEVILGGENIGIYIDTPGIMVIGFYRVNGSFLKGTPEIKIGDYITKVNDTLVNTIDDLTDAILKEVIDNQVTLTVFRNGEEITITMTLEVVDDIYKTGLYVKDSISGIGTLTYIDPETKIYGALGHEIVESSSSKMVEVKEGIIFESKITGIKKSSDGIAGEKNAEFYSNKKLGTININTNHGIYGIYNQDTLGSIIEVASNDEVKVGEATIYTVLDGYEKEAFTIEITSIQEFSDTKNITFQITDEDLINKTGGIVQGMSGSPIVQNNKIVGAVTHVIVDNPLTGYGIFITTMLKTGDELLG